MRLARSRARSLAIRPGVGRGGPVGRAVAEGQFRGFHHQRDARGGAAAQQLQIELLHQVQLLEQDVSAGIGRGLIDRVAPVGGGDGFLPPGMAIGQVLHGEQATLLITELDDGPGDLPLIKGVPATVHDGLEGLGQVPLVDQFPRRRRTAAVGADGLRGREFAQQGIAGDDP